jgi:hypothetical protein
MQLSAANIDEDGRVIDLYGPSTIFGRNSSNYMFLHALLGSRTANQLAGFIESMVIWNSLPHTGNGSSTRIARPNFSSDVTAYIRSRNYSSYYPYTIDKIIYLADLRVYFAVGMSFSTTFVDNIYEDDDTATREARVGLVSAVGSKYGFDHSKHVLGLKDLQDLQLPR